MADALETDVAVAVLAAGQGDAFVAAFTVEAQFAEALAWTVTVALERVAAWTAFGDVAQVTRPAGQAFYFAIVAADVMGVLVLGCWDLTGLRS